MFYYEVAILGSALNPLTYESKNEFLDGDIVNINLRNKSSLGVVIQEVKKPSFKTLPISSKSNLKFTQLQINLAKFISYYYSSFLGVSYDLFEPYSEFKNTNLYIQKTPNLNEIQKKAFEFIDKHDVSLLFGDTGSGKSEVYISHIAKAINSGKTALFLMPEISLTPQMQKRLKQYFGDSVGVWHSKINKNKKAQILSKLQNGEIKLIAGARSALFLPFNNLGLVIVDEEHDDSYKSSSNPHYNARDLAIYISKFGVKVILGSATPCITTIQKQPYFRMKGTFFKSKKEYIFDDNETSISEVIIENIAKCLERKKQIVVFLPTRANFKFITCKSCFSTIKCPYCSVSMSYHKRENMLKCHYCGYATKVPKICDKCGGDMLEAKKIGTSEVLIKLSEIFPEAKIAKFDRDEITTQKKLENILKDFNDKKIDILVGTQMLSKGHDYHNVELAVILGLDEYLEYSDFRAREKTLALAMQVAGRAGRLEYGKVIFQTKKIDFFKKFISDYDSFINEEITFRDPLYPPFSKLMRINILSKKDEEANFICLECVKILEKFLIKMDDFEIIGYGKSPIELIASKFRYNILLRAKSHKPLIKISSLLQNKNIDIDIDPINFS
ncbi:MAG: primosomal protein N' [Campylobacter sputorum]|uniref:primosomal protein N' n=1 Tax=Campylobacter sputorum TaxID=206 RepID=UPI000B78AFDB|nr:primosomal protein N' [Campylobacter sputorum]ASM38901.1 primosomal protein N' [Campylobacter sputorum bv. paraureolyticus LMG 11764]MDY6121142.1 primosomal protein N' [Campylobacter sputorum]